MIELDLTNDPAKTNLIVAGDTVRDIGMDMLSASLGKLSEDSLIKNTSSYSMQLAPEDCKGVFDGLQKLVRECQRTGQSQLVGYKAGSVKIAYSVEVSMLKEPAGRDASENDPLGKNQMLKVRIVIWHANGRQTEIVVKLNRDRNGYYWLGVIGNPTSLLNKYNAFAVALPNASLHAERRILQRVPFLALRRIIRSVLPTFEWHRDTKQRIKDLAFRNCPAQVFTFMPTLPRKPEQIMGYMRSTYSIPYKAGKHDYRLLCDDLNIEVQTRGQVGELQTLLFLFRKGGRIAWSVSFYNKLAKAEADAEAIKTAVADKKTLEFLAYAVRVDITIHEDGQRDMYHEAGFGTREKAKATADEYCRAIRAMDSGQGLSGKKFVRWMLDFIFDEKLKFWSLLRYSPKRIDKARRLLEPYNKEAAAAFVEWYQKGFEFIPSGDLDGISFVQFLEEHAMTRVSRDVARRSRQKLLAMQLDPDIPLRAYDAFYNQTYVWDLEDGDRHKLAKALEAGNDKAVGLLQQAGRLNSVEVIKEIRSAFGKMIEAAHTPANTLGAQQGTITKD